MLWGYSRIRKAASDEGLKRRAVEFVGTSSKPALDFGVAPTQRKRPSAFLPEEPSYQILRTVKQGSDAVDLVVLPELGDTGNADNCETAEVFVGWSEGKLSVFKITASDLENPTEQRSRRAHARLTRITARIRLLYPRRNISIPLRSKP